MEGNKSCNWCFTPSVPLVTGKNYCSVCAHYCFKECKRCRWPLPSADFFSLSKERCNTCQKKYLKEVNKRLKSSCGSNFQNYPDQLSEMEYRNKHGDTDRNVSISSVDEQEEDSISNSESSVTEEATADLCVPVKEPAPQKKQHKFTPVKTEHKKKTRRHHHKSSDDNNEEADDGSDLLVKKLEKGKGEIQKNVQLKKRGRKKKVINVKKDMMLKAINEYLVGNQGSLFKNSYFVMSL